MNTKTETKVVSVPKDWALPERTIESLIKAHPFLEGLSPHQYRLLGDCAMSAHFDAGEVIFAEGDPANRFYLIQKGHLALESQTADRGIVSIQTLGPGDVLGWSWLFPPYFWHFGARALAPTEAIFIYATPLRHECEADHELGYELMKRMAAVMLTRLQAARRQWLGLSFPAL
jgi:CRP-like cAMP-binding protein